MAAVMRDHLRIPRGYRSTEVASFVRQLDLLSASLDKAAPRLRVHELEWQPAPGMNTIGMLLAHIAIAEVWWIEVGCKETPGPEVDFRRVLGIGPDEDGMDDSPDARHPRALRGKPHAFYRRLLAKARAHTRRGARGLTARDLSRPRRRTRLDGRVQQFDARWVLFHMVEHAASHIGQIQLLRHAYRVRGRRGGKR